MVAQRKQAVARAGSHSGAAMTGQITPVAQVVLARISAEGGATRASIVADLAQMFTHKLSPADWRRRCEKEVAALLDQGLVNEARSRLTVTEVGLAEIAAYFGQKGYEPKPWPILRDTALIAKGLGIEKLPASWLKTLIRVDSLRALTVQKAFGLSVRKNQPAAKLRAQLAMLALERAFGNRIKAGFGKSFALSSTAARLLAGQLSHTPREFATDAKLIAALAAECVGTVDASLEGLRKAIMRKVGAHALETSAQPSVEREMRNAAIAPVLRSSDPPPMLAPVANDPLPAASAPPEAVRPDMPEFARAVNQAAQDRAEGWPGSRKAYISHVWAAIREGKPQWELSEIEFKCMLAEAHRLGAVVLANADLKDKKSLEELEKSAVPYKNTVWHFVRVEE